MSDIVCYPGNAQVRVKFDGETVWLTQGQIAYIYLIQEFFLRSAKINSGKIFIFFRFFTILPFDKIEN